MPLVAHFDLELYQMDVKTFLNRDLEEHYMKQHKGFCDNSRKACKLRKNYLWG